MLKDLIRPIPLLCALAMPAGAQTDTLRVGVIERPRFAMTTSDGALEGAAVELWRLVAEDLGLGYGYVMLDDGEAAAALATGRADVVLPVTATPELEAETDLTQPIYTATLAVAEERGSQVLEVVKGFASWQFVRLVAGLSVLLLIVGAVIWLVERRRNEDQFSRGIVKGLGDGFWWAGVTLTTIGYGDKAPVTLAGRTVAMLWMLTGLAVSAALTAAVVTMAGVQQEDDLIGDLAEARVGVIAGAGTAEFLEGRVGALAPYADVPAALDALRTDAVDVVAAAAPVLRHFAGGDINMAISTSRLDPHYVTFALPQGAPLRERLNHALLERVTGESGQQVMRRYFGDG
ncbi:ion channel [Tranquillimonas alkanivorans]|uniref:Amino acid ABC transporter substrate-binding protein, PAAT family n=1 Tax=Tranquillimonas alkanivorans TaxID=441119 RepID=A0A1I5KF61_9RHOB|nr:transporter substrate-binding domain-containing protein [Tranquillimonas alkanivorans]SFO83246.1 amino acid ABC transporter substrate-binding protein, PAAT family [Tranquillimonas alkanivorans]